MMSNVIMMSPYPVGIYLLKVNNKNTRTRCEICSKLTKKDTPCSSVSIVNFEHVNADWVMSFNYFRRKLDH